MSVTAFPVLARILTDRGIHKTKMGTLTLTCAAVGDVSAWCLLAFVVSVTQSRAASALPVIGMSIAYILVMVFLVRPAILQVSRFIDAKGHLTQGALALVLLGILLSSLATEGIGIHAIFGAFALGAIIPHDSEISRELTAKLEDFIVVFLLPAFFAFTGLRTQIGLLNDARQWTYCVLIILIASIGKFGGSFIAGRWSGLSWRDSAAVGVLMNTRGLMELIVLNIGLELGVISPALFSMLVIMALATTFATTPILHFILPAKELELEASKIEEASRGAKAASERVGILVPVSSANGVASVLNLALTLNVPDGPPPRVLALARAGGEGIGSGLRKAEDPAPSRSPALAAALDLAWSRGAVVTPQAVWTHDPAGDIIRAAQESQVRWLFLESRRTLLTGFSGRFVRHGVVGKVVQRAEPLPINVAVLLEGNVRLAGPTTCIVRSARHGRAALELAAQLARVRQESFRLVTVNPSSDADTANDVLDLRREQRLVANLDVITISASTTEEVVRQTPNGVVIVGADVVERLHILSEAFLRTRTVLVIQGAGGSVTEVPSAPVQLQPASAT